VRTVIPGQVSPKYIEALRDWQVNFLATITASDEDADRYRKACPDWVKDGKNGVSRKKHT
jgi:hypothetical protein